MARPLIGITKPARGDNLAFFCICAAIWLAGGRPLRLTARRPREARRIDGLVLGGGSDVFPRFYAAAPKDNYAYDHNRDEMEIAWARRAHKADIPVLGICRGAQLMNVLDDGTLHMAVRDAYPDADYPGGPLGYLLYRKTILVTQGSRLFAALRAGAAKVNSMHKQAIDRVGDGLAVTACERNGVVQAIENPRRRFYVGVQFHPEFLIHRARFRRIFGEFVQAAREGRGLQAAE